ncbi:UTP--glucose-1-phosphate uridylyltransferase GalU [Brevibacillus choshinensis]|uniref:UTP--glucose-1-phosphate uridylyltransferase GalU n=1 Tax=Brevibacillus choshinensis TaxID=54911 RepID=UPI002E1F3ABE|nr:UTP--glucose-1-phosphate uridylyltransferase GalU [Brevibacillus choshinensis]MED4583095.1 UTP--glucose-1-phosphate uridylyltransferase GalU [Brevibacillus choshinensis]MED4753014.1 UTP--glucose-1-phosphate uridylyltransferase GalU [Brevibacillus choshinensis]MED4781410.1 UTP--glucose-1-phosphate uridylyltransferase GalU [Brevibacillus choshinensis]
MAQSKIKKAIIPAAGLGTRFLPATKAMPKEMLPIVDKPTIQYIVEEAVEAGIEDIIIVTGKGKRAIEDHFDSAFELEQNLLEKQKLDLLDQVRYSAKIANIHYIRQKEPLGLGHAIWCARKFVGNEPFAVLLGDDIVRSDVPCIKQLSEIFDHTNCSVIGVQEVPEEHTSRYGVIDPVAEEGGLYRVRACVEKPPRGTAPSNLAIMGRYILTPDIFAILDSQEKGAGGEVQLTDAIQRLNEQQTVYAYQFEGVRYDVGDKLGYITTTIEFAMRRDELRTPLLHYLENWMQGQTITQKR